MKGKRQHEKITKVILYTVLIFVSLLILVPFAWMLSSSLKLDKDVFVVPIQWIPKDPQWENYIKIWTKIPLATFVVNTAKLTLIVTLLQLFTSSFAAYAFAKLNFRYKNLLFLAYVATIAVPWQVYMVPQFMMMRSFGLNDTHLAIICLQAFSAFGVFMMRQFYQGIPDELCEAARIDGMSEYQIYGKIMLPLAKPQAFSAFGVFMMRQFYQGIPDELCEAARIDGMSEYQIYGKIMLPLAKPALSTLTIFTFVNTWNDFLGPLIYLKTESKKTLQIGLRMFIGQNSSEYGLIMAASVLSLIPVLIVFLALQKYFVEGIAATGVKG